MFLRELRDGVSTLRGIGKTTQGTLESAGIFTVADLLLHFPRGYEDRKTSIPFAQIGDSGVANTVIRVVEHEFFGFGAKRTLKIRVKDDTSDAALVCFGRSFLSRALVPGRLFFLYGQFSRRYGELQSSSFETEPFSESPSQFNGVIPIYQLTGRLTQNFFRKFVTRVLEQYGQELEDELPEYVVQKHGLLDKRTAVREIHFPLKMETAGHARRALAFEELYHLQLAIKRKAVKAQTVTREKRNLAGDSAKLLIKRLSFSLTADQERVVEEIKTDLEKNTPMTRLLQGDVGCGKTLVALLSAAMMIDAGYQVALMAPTELLGRQHAESAAQLLEPAGMSVALLSGGVGSESRRHLLTAMSLGKVDLIVGTHSLFSADICYMNLGMVIVDEQHRFGVLQRIALVQKGNRNGVDATVSTNPDLLLMTATPIPRSLALTIFGDLDISTIRTMPPGRKPITTHLAKIGNEAKVYEWVRREVGNGHQAYFVYPLIEQSDKLDLKSAKSMESYLRSEIFAEFTLALIHSRLPEEEKRETMRGFQNGSIQILIATSVVEVGVNVPNATCMVIEHAERFGLSSLHQMRGRVGRAEYPSYAFLVFSEDLGEDARNRLVAMKDTTDGFVIAEKDLSIRGPGELTGLQQSGKFKLNIADILSDTDLLFAARKEVIHLLGQDPGLLSPAHSQVRKVLQRAPPFADDFVEGG